MNVVKYGLKALRINEYWCNNFIAKNVYVAAHCAHFRLIFLYHCIIERVLWSMSVSVMKKLHTKFSLNCKATMTHCSVYTFQGIY